MLDDELVAGAEGLDLLDDDPPPSTRRPSSGPGSGAYPDKWASLQVEPERVQPRSSSGPANLTLVYVGIGAGTFLVVIVLTAVFVVNNLGGARSGPAAGSGPASAIAPDTNFATVARETASSIDSTPAKALSTADIAEKNESSIALIKGGMSSGTGFLVGENLLATNAHVIGDELISSLEVRFPSAAEGKKGPLQAELLYEDTKRDLAFLAIKSPLPPLAIASTYQYRKGDDVTVIGNPGIGNEMVLENAISRGVMSTKVKLGDQNFYQLGISINPGNSGGPVFDLGGRVIGVATLKITQQEALAFCIPVEDLRKALSRLANQTAQTTEVIRARHRLLGTFKGLSGAGALYSLGLELHLAQRSTPKDKDLNELVEKFDAIVGELFSKAFTHLDIEASQLRNDSSAQPETLSKIDELSGNYAKLKTAFEQAPASTAINSIREMKATHRRLINDLKEDLKVEIPEGLMEALADHLRQGGAFAGGPMPFGPHPMFPRGGPIRPPMFGRRPSIGNPNGPSRPQTQSGNVPRRGKFGR